MAYGKQKISGAMPAHYFSDDAQWISTQLGRLCNAERVRICDAYSAVYMDAFDAEPVEHKKINKGRFAANTRLRVYIKKKFAVFS